MNVKCCDLEILVSRLKINIYIKEIIVAVNDDTFKFDNKSVVPNIKINSTKSILLNYVAVRF